MGKEKQREIKAEGTRRQDKSVRRQVFLDTLRAKIRYNT